MKRFAKSYAVCLFLTGLLLVLCMGCPAGMVLLVLLKGNPLLFWVLTALLPVVPALAWAAWKVRPGASGKSKGNNESTK